MIMQCDTRQKLKHHNAKEAYFRSMGIKLVNSKMLVGDYCVPSDGSISVDTKGSISELYGNLIQQHERFRNECILAKQCGIKLYILVENKDGIGSVNDISKWKNPQMYRYFKTRKKALKDGLKPPRGPASNVQLIKIMERDYGVEFLFCRPEDAGSRILSLLNMEPEV